MGAEMSHLSGKIRSRIFFLRRGAVEHLNLEQRIELLRRMAIRLASAIRPCEVLTVVNREINMMQRVMRWSIDDVLERMTGDHVRIMNEDAPEVDRNKKCEVQVPLNREKEDEQVVRERLSEAIDRVERMGCEWRRYCHRVSVNDEQRTESERTYPLMMRLMQSLVDKRYMEPAVYPIDAEVGEQQEPGRK